MALFQKSVLKKYLNELSVEDIEKSYSKFQSIFNNPAKQQNIINSKEEQYQEGFLRELFVQILGYTLNPDENFNLITEQKNETDSKKADGAILNGLQILSVIELKSTKTIDLASVESQAFGYKNNQQGCKYVITSNFRKLRFYIENAIDFEEFDLFNLSKDHFKLLWICLSSDYLLKDIPAQIKSISNNEEENVTKKLYADYANFRKALFQDISIKNPQTERILIFKKTQKLLDRFLFLFFAEDRGLVSPNWTRKILQDWTDLKDRYDNYLPLYSRFRKNFEYLNTGYSGKDGEVFAYNGGLFAPDELLDSLLIDDDLLYKGSLKLSNYDFETEVDVNILGHIFEHSLNEIDEIEASLIVDVKSGINKVTKRKKDGVFYTPKYITKYIVENTIGTLCKEQKVVLGLVEDEFEYIDAKAKGALKTKREVLNQKINDYRKWLLELKIVDPACGSGAFLNQALEFLIAEHRKIDELKAELLGGSFVLSDVENSILENNLYGVDLNEEGIEIAKLSLWLRTARKGRKLSSLNRNIKCGNSLIEDVSVAGDKAFNWQAEFADVFNQGGFDVVIGNPPYVDIKNLPAKTSKYIFSKYVTSENRINLYSIFIEKGFNILANNGLLSFINPNSMLVNSSYRKLRELLIDSLIQIVKLPDDVFLDAKVETIIFVCQRMSNKNAIKILSYPKDAKINSIDFEGFSTVRKEEWLKEDSINFNLYLSDSISKVISQIEKNSSPLQGDCYFSLGITPYDKYKGHSESDINNRVFHSSSKLNESYKPLISGENIIRHFTLPHVKGYIKYGDWLGRPREERFFTEERIIVRQIISGNPPRIYASYANQQYFFTHHGFGLIPKSTLAVKYLLVIMNSKLINYYHTYKFLDIEKRLFQKFLIESCKKLPIKVINMDCQQSFIIKADNILSYHRDLNVVKWQFLQLIQAKVGDLSITKNLNDWPSLSSKEFIKGIEKNKVRLSLSEQAEWLEYFEEQKYKALSIKSQIEKTDKEIDHMVYDLYELTEDEIQIVENYHQE
ncbi:TaqI-like C-terminal specificity domain-containing protein [Daejeonella rubra]|uniref:site-specific DNA-methyltransferase (adenine-specific) n=1 Tax=Daejeonella rubra TaxID=990371 RepID=A0A1G9XRW6_9SPHI|nr:N-6 DNA methylase [Daejeonella rubra]SDM99547.1 TaqI-like C-terminal specificity domain-containing protein [Daejeonella rubra]